MQKNPLHLKKHQETQLSTYNQSVIQMQFSAEDYNITDPVKYEHLNGIV